MLKLPSGHTVTISSERARYHATRLSLNITRESPHRSLYALIDILHLDERTWPAAKTRLLFTGFTLDDQDWIGRWRPDDRARFLDWISQHSQVLQIESARRKLIYDTLPHRIESYDYPERLYSALRRRVLAMTMRGAPPLQWVRTLQNMQQCGIREEELRWSGVIAFLKGAATAGRDFVSREEVISHIDFTDIRLELTTELVRDDAPALPFRPVASKAAALAAASGLDCHEGQAVLRFVDPRFGYRILLLRTRARGRWFVIDPQGAPIEAQPYQGFTDAAMAQRAAADDARQRFGLIGSLRPSDKYLFMSLEGGEDYREWILTLPDFPHSHFTPHFTERNVLLHFRTKTRRDAQGHRLLFIEEIQSDWHQQAAAGKRPSSWHAPIPAAPFRREWGALALKLLLLHAIDGRYDGIAWAPGALQQLRFQTNAQPLLRLYDHDIPDLLAHLSRPWGGRIRRTLIRTREPWISPFRVRDHWSVRDRTGRFHTRPALNRAEAITLCHRHSRRIDLEVPWFEIPDAMRDYLAVQGLPRFGEVGVDRVKRPLCGDDGATGCSPERMRACLHPSDDTASPPPVP